MNAIISQAIAILLIIAIGVGVFKYDTLKVNAKNIALASFLIVLSILLAMFSVMIPFFGFPSLKFGFSQLPLMILGVVLGPAWAFISGIVQDILSLLMDPTNYPFFGFTLNKVLIALLPALCFSKKNRLSSEHIYLFAQGVLVMLFVVANLALWNTSSINMGSDSITVNVYMKVFFTAFFLIVVGFILFGIYYMKKKMLQENKGVDLNRWILSILLVELAVQLCLTPLWLDIMYDIPFVVSSLMRVVKSCFMILINIAVGYFILQVIHKLKPIQSAEKLNENENKFL